MLPLRRYRPAPGWLARPDLQGGRLDRDPRRRDGGPQRLRLRAGQRLRPRAGPGLRLRHGDRADRDAQVRCSRSAQVFRERRPGPGAVPMKVPESWLRAYCDPEVGLEEIGDRLAMHTTEVERISQVGAPSPERFVVGKVLSVERHPDADKLSICQVDAGDGGRTIVCGAPNVAAGQTVPVALPGAVMPDGTKLGKAKLRGVESNGMILSEAELELGDDAAGIAVRGEGGAGPDRG